MKVISHLWRKLTDLPQSFLIKDYIVKNEPTNPKVILMKSGMATMAFAIRWADTLAHQLLPATERQSISIHSSICLIYHCTL